MEYYRNLLKDNQKSTFRLILGILFLIGSIFIITDRIIDYKSISAFDWSFSAIFALNGLINISKGLGTSMERFVGKAYIQIDINTFNIKYEVYNKVQTIDWQDIQLVGFGPHAFIFQIKDLSTRLFPITKFDNSCISDMKEIISEIADYRKIKINIQPYLEGIDSDPIKQTH
jgi:hypothetical protein